MFSAASRSDGDDAFGFIKRRGKRRKKRQQASEHSDAVSTTSERRVDPQGPSDVSHLPADLDSPGLTALIEGGQDLDSLPPPSNSTQCQQNANVGPSPRRSRGGMFSSAPATSTSAESGVADMLGTLGIVGNKRRKMKRYKAAARRLSRRIKDNEDDDSEEWETDSDYDSEDEEIIDSKILKYKLAAERLRAKIRTDGGNEGEDGEWETDSEAEED